MIPESRVHDTGSSVKDLDRPFFIIGTERSGSNLLRLVLNSHSRLFVPHPPHIMKFMRPLAPSYGDLSHDANFYDLVRDACRLVDYHTYPWDVQLHPEEIMERCRERTLFAVYAAAYERFLQHVGKARWGCKSTFMIHEAPAVLRQYPHAQFLLLVRDVRDVAVSARKSVFNHFHPYYVAKLWAHEQRVGREMLESLPPDRILLLHYEAFVQDPENQVQRVCDFLKEPFEKSQLSFFKTEEAQKSSSLCLDWKNTSEGFLQTNFGKFVTELESEEVAIIERVADREMQYYGYRLAASEAERALYRNPPPAARIRYYVMEHSQKFQVELESLKNDKNYPLRVRKTLYLYWLKLKSGVRGILRWLQRMLEAPRRALQT